jgi:hypothetical protein
MAASPDGKKLAFTWRGQIWVVGVDGSNLMQITEAEPVDLSSHLESMYVANFVSPTWSPDSKWVASIWLRNTTGGVVGGVFPSADATVAPVYQVLPSPGAVANGRCSNPLVVFPADKKTMVTRWDPENFVRMRHVNKVSLRWLTTCAEHVFWLP